MTLFKLSAAVALAAALAGAPAFAADQDDVLAAMNRFLVGFNQGDVAKIVASCADETSIIDDFAPHEWHGAGACAKWAADYDADAKKNVITDGAVTLKKPKHVDVTGDVAYVVVAADYVYKQKGKPVKELGSTMTLVMKKTGTDWRITAWSWAMR